MKVIGIIFAIAFGIIAIIFKIIGAVLSLGFGMIQAGQFAEDEENGYH